MKKTVWTFGLICGALLSVMLVANTALMDRLGFDRAEVLGYASIVAAFLLIFFGIRSYRENSPERAVGFGRALAIGLLISTIASACYALSWVVLQPRLAPDFAERYTEHTLERERAAGASEAEIASRSAELARYAELARNPLVNFGATFLEPFVIGVIVSFVAAGLLRGRPSGTGAAHARGTAAAQTGGRR